MSDVAEVLPAIPGTEKTGLPGIPAPPKPGSLAGPVKNLKVGPGNWTDAERAATEQGGELMVSGVKEAGEGAGQVAEGVRERNPRKVAGGASKAIRGAGKAAWPVAAVGAAMNPGLAIAGLAGGMAAQEGTERGLKAVGVPDEYAALGSDAVGALPILAAGAKIKNSLPRYKRAPVMEAKPKPIGHKEAVYAENQPPRLRGEQPAPLEQGAPLPRAPKPLAPETGVPESVSRAVDSRQRIAVETTGKPWDQLSNSERIAVDELITESKPRPIEAPRRESQRGSISNRPIEPLTPTEQYAKDMVAAREAARGAGGTPSIREKASEFVADLKRKFVSSTAPITDRLKRDQSESGYEILPKQNIQYYIDRARRAPSIAQQFVKDKGLDRIIRDVEDLDYLDQYLIARHARHLDADVATGRNEAMDAQFIRDFENRPAVTKGGKEMTYEQVAQQVDGYSRDLLDYATDAGLIAPELSAHLKQRYPQYVPLKRVFAEIEMAQGHSNPKAPAHLGQQTVVQKIKGSEREIENPLESMIDKTLTAFSQGERNKAGRTLAGYRDLPGFQGLIREVKAGEGSHIFSYYENGQKRYFETTPEIATAAKAMDVQTIGLIGRILGAPVRLFKVGTTGINLPFVASNVMADQVFTAITARHLQSNAHPVTFTRALFNALKHGDLYDEMVRNGSGFTSFDMVRGQSKQTVQSLRAGNSVRSAGDLFRRAENLVGRSEEFGRLRLYGGEKMSRLKEGRTPDDAQILATIEANNALPNYYDFGDWMRPLNSVVPYINASIQGTRSFLGAAERAARGGPAEQAKFAAKVATTLFLPTSVLTMWNLSDPKRAEAYRDIKEYEKENNFIWIPPNPTKDERGQWNVLKVKIPPGINNLTIPVRRAIEAASGLDPVRFGEMVRAAVGTVSPIDPDSNKAISQLIPQAVKPTAQAAANYDFFRESPRVPPHLQEKPAEMQTLPYTSGTSKAIGRATGKSPVLVEGFINDTLGGIGPQALHASDKALGAVGAIPKDDVRGGQSTMESVAARFGKARGGATDEREYTKVQQVRADADLAQDAEDRKAQDVLKQLESAPDPATKAQELASAGILTDDVLDRIEKFRQRQQARAELNGPERMLKSSSADARARYVLDKLANAPEDQQEAMLRSFVEKGIVTDAVLDAIEKRQTAAAQ
jgi:hypothetical protein